MYNLLPIESTFRNPSQIKTHPRTQRNIYKKKLDVILLFNLNSREEMGWSVLLGRGEGDSKRK